LRSASAKTKNDEIHKVPLCRRQNGILRATA